MNDGTLTITEYLSSCHDGRGPRFLGPKIEKGDPTAEERFDSADMKLLGARLALADAEADLYGRDPEELRAIAQKTHTRHRAARRGRPATP